MKLDREQIAETALSLMGEVGLDALSTRALAAKLGVKQPALYWHFKSRRDLLDAMNNLMLSGLSASRAPRHEEDLMGFLARGAREFRAALCAHRDGARLHAGTEASVEDLEPSERQMEFMVLSGFTTAGAFDLLVAISRYTLGCVLEEQADAERVRDSTVDREVIGYPYLSKGLTHYRNQSHCEAFESGLTLLLAGAGARLVGRS